MKLEKFKEKDKKKIGIIVFTISCSMLITGVILYRTFAVFETNDYFNVINGTIKDVGDIYFAFYKDDQIVKNAPAKNENYSFNPIKSHCTNDATVEWDNGKWGALVSNISETKTKCYLYFERNEISMFRQVNESTSDGMYQYKNQISKIVFQTKIDSIEGETAYFDESVNQDQSLVSRIVPTENDKYILYIQANGKIKANSDSSLLFNKFSNVTEIEGIENFDTSLATNLYGLFKGMSSLQEIDVSYFDTSKTQIISDIFNGCKNLSSITGINNWNTEAVTDMQSVFSSTSITFLDLSHWKTNKVTRMDALFSDTKLTELKGIAEWDTSSLSSINFAFTSTNLNNLNLSGWNTKNITSMIYVFQNSKNLTQIIYGPNFQKNANAKTTGMFNNCPANHPEHDSWKEVIDWN